MFGSPVLPHLFKVLKDEHLSEKKKEQSEICKAFLSHFLLHFDMVSTPVKHRAEEVLPGLIPGQSLLTNSKGVSSRESRDPGFILWSDLT